MIAWLVARLALTGPVSWVWAFLTSRIGLSALAFAGGFSAGVWIAHDHEEEAALRQEITNAKRDIAAARASALQGQALARQLQALRQGDEERIRVYEQELAAAPKVPEPPPPIEAAPVPECTPPASPAKPPRPAVRPDRCLLGDRDIDRLRPIGR
jgi:hypothetical protein